MSLEHDIQELNAVLRTLTATLQGIIKIPLVLPSLDVKPTAEDEKVLPMAEKKKKKEPVVVTHVAGGTEDNEPTLKVHTEATYDKVKSLVLEVVNRKGRGAVLDILSEFGVVKGEGDERQGNIAGLKPEQYQAVIERVQKVMGA